MAKANNPIKDKILKRKDEITKSKVENSQETKQLIVEDVKPVIPTLKDAPMIAIGIDVGSAIKIPEPIRVPDDLIVDETIVNKTPDIEHPSNIIQQTAWTYFGNNEDMNKILRVRKSYIEDKIKQYKNVHSIYKSAGNFNRDTAMLVANRLAGIYKLPIVFDNNNGLFIFWNASTKSHTTLDIFGGFGMNTIGDMANRNRFATNFNFAQWSLNIYEPLMKILERQAQDLIDLSVGDMYEAIATLMKADSRLTPIILQIIKEKR